MKGFFKTATAACLLLGLVSPFAVSAGERAPKMKVEPLTARELTQIYGDKTWTWNTGGGRFNGRQHGFVAWTNEKNKPSFGEGRWAVDDNGKLCIFAKWTAADGAGRAATCFGHAKVGATIYQRRHPFGNWYVFRHAKPRASDEFRKLVDADTVGPKAARLKKTLAATR
ncbi:MULTISPECIES: DUF995 domain-containing protein [Ciceribacter]|uniref:Uncharacterized protein DUF995 n=1 Tax=Ciceribacter lividus TaxID=1197950 RepID=A0A6I7HIR0_9HYPH|nr:MULTISPECIES: DUF995 domain-containing protein [Ciceribacter]RCW21087.1 uncharacterized protein DUF995 [Ciceribacter lividus]